MNCVCTAGFAADRCVFSSGEGSGGLASGQPSMLGQDRFCRGSGRNLGICHENAQVCRTPAKFLLEKTGTVRFFKKKMKGYGHKPGQFQGTQSKLPRFFVCRIISGRTVRRREGGGFK